MTKIDDDDDSLILQIFLSTRQQTPLNRFRRGQWTGLRELLLRTGSEVMGEVS